MSFLPADQKNKMTLLGLSNNEGSYFLSAYNLSRTFMVLFFLILTTSWSSY